MKHNYPVVFKVAITTDEKIGPLVEFTIEEGFRKEVYELDADEAITTGSQMIQAAHEVRKRKK